MKSFIPYRALALWLFSTILALGVLTWGGVSGFGAQDPWVPSEVLQPEALATVLKTAPPDQRPLLIHVGFDFLYRNGHIPGSHYAGPARESAGLARLRAELKDVPKSRQIVLYCGCCPMGKCPNLRPAFRTVRAMGFTRVRILSLADNFDKNWIKKGYPTEKR